MKFITESRLLMELIVSLAAGIGIPPEAVLAIIGFAGQRRAPAGA